jgi:hypothetical protein
MGNLVNLCDRVDMPEPTIEFIKDTSGGYWEVSYAGMVRRHQQEWQAWCFYEMARAACVVMRPANLLPRSGRQTSEDP